MQQTLNNSKPSVGDSTEMSKKQFKEKITKCFNITKNI